ncbi:MAG: hypothetical protein HKN05_03900 [Rhizobiales bacterium]|nr:hypothetical protein [Hyphomicrobiales bacterium]
MDIAIIGWGSLIWDLEILEPKVNPRWQRGTGPILPLEFSRVSPKRQKALALIVDPDHGTECATSLVISKRSTLEEAVEDLAARERAPLDRIGYASRSGSWRSTVSGLEQRFEVWFEEHGFSGAVWTDLPGNFEHETGNAFSIAAAVDYLRTLQGTSLLEAKRYIELAPEETMTALRKTLGTQDWWADVPLEPNLEQSS